MSYLPLARKWRPQNFDEVVGQEHITTTLKNAILMDRVHHAYLFTGPRGIGKTSTARILSKALNCEKGPSPVPCNKCGSCLEINNGSGMDVLEIDGASNRGIDEIRNLRETVKFSPSKGKFKIYIIDEVHMLTNEAFNALLKTLEEPPAHVKFIFATTEPHKLPATILSRCHRFDFRRISVKEIIEKLKEVAKEEKIEIEEEVFLYIAKAGDGSMRDSESILDQVSSFSKGKVTVEDVVNALGMIEQELLFKTTELIIGKDTKGVICLIDELLNSGKDAKQFLIEMLEHFRNIMIVKSGVTSGDLIDLPKEAVERVSKQAGSFSQGDIFYIMNVIANHLKMIKQLFPERIVLELCVIKLANRDSISSIQEILSKLPGAVKMPEPQPRQAQAQPQPAAGKTYTPPADAAKTMHQKIREALEQKKPENTVIPDAKASIEISRVKNAWPILVKAMAVKRMSISSYLSEGVPDSVKGNVAFIAFPKELNFHREILEERDNKRIIEEALSQILDVPAQLQFVPTENMVKKNNPDTPPQVTRQVLKDTEPVIEATLDIFGGKLLKNTEEE